MAVARESLSPLMRNVHSRRLSLELCQKIGNHILSPNASPNRNPVNVSMNWSPKNSFYNYSESPVQTTPTFAQRRGSADHDVFNKSISPLSMCGKHPRRRSLTPLNAQNNKIVGQQTFPQGLPFPIPSINVQDSPSFRSAKESEVKPEKSTPRKGSTLVDGSGLFCNVIPIAGTHDRTRRTSHHSPATNCAFTGQRRKSSSSRYDFDEDFMKFVFIRCGLQLYPDDVLGRGSFGTVIQGQYHGQAVAVKVIKTNTLSHLESTKGEQNGFGLSHPHVAKVVDIFQMGPERALVVMELMKKGNLLKLLNDTRIAIDPPVKLRISGQIASALQYCHQKGILHLDVKPQNILIDFNDNCKLSDFGTSKKISETSMMPNVNRLEGTVAYKAPELFRGNIPTEKCDVYSFGVCMWQILYREEPYQGLPEHSIIYQVVAQGLRPNRFTGPIDLNDVDCQDLLTSHYATMYEACWHAEPHFRPDMKTIVEKLLLTLYNV